MKEPVEQTPVNLPPSAAPPATSTLILQVAGQCIVPLSLVLAAFIYFKGHQTPGGGFVAGLVSGVGLVLHRMTFGAESLNRLLPVRESTLIAAGLLLSVLTAVVPMFLGQPFFRSAHGYIPLPGGGLFGQPYFEWASVMAFDFGVVLVVCGMVVGSIEALTQEAEAAVPGSDSEPGGGSVP